MKTEAPYTVDDGRDSGSVLALDESLEHADGQRRHRGHHQVYELAICAGDGHARVHIRRVRQYASERHVGAHEHHVHIRTDSTIRGRGRWYCPTNDTVLSERRDQLGYTGAVCERDHAIVHKLLFWPTLAGDGDCRELRRNQ